MGQHIKGDPDILEILREGAGLPKFHPDATLEENLAIIDRHINNLQAQVDIIKATTGSHEKTKQSTRCSRKEQVAKPSGKKRRTSA